MHHYNSRQYCSTKTVLLIFPFLQTNVTSQMWPSGGKLTQVENYERQTHTHMYRYACVCTCTVKTSSGEIKSADNMKILQKY